MPKNIIPLFETFGKSLGQGNFIRVQARRRSDEAICTKEVRERLATWLERTYIDRVDQIGEVRATDLDGGRFIIRMEDGAKVEGRFSPEQESMVTDALKDHLTQRLRVIGQGEYLRDSGRLKKINEVSDISIVPVEEVGYNDSVRPIWEIVSAIGAEVSMEEWKNVPEDLAKNLDHYLYGTTKEGGA